MKVLFVDDSKAIHAFLKDIFSTTPHEVDHAMSGEEAVEKIIDQSIAYDLIFLDWEMPGLKGPDVLQKVRGSGKNVPIIMLTSKNSPEDIALTLEQGANEYIMKPFTPEIIFEKMETVVGS